MKKQKLETETEGAECAVYKLQPKQVYKKLVLYLEYQLHCNLLDC